MTFSIIVPTFNSSLFLQATLDSIKNQSYQNFEVLIADGGSKDDTLKIASLYSFVKVASIKDLSQTDGINKAMHYCSGDIVAWQNSDDIYDIDCFKTVVESFKNSSSDIVYGNYNLIDKNGKLIKRCVSYKWDIAKFKTGRFVPLQPTLFWKKKVSDDIFPLDINLKYCMDVDFLAKAANKKFDFLYIDTCLGSFRIHQAGKTSQIQDTLNVLKEHRDVLRRNFYFNAIESSVLFLRLTKLFLIKMILNFRNTN